MVARSTVVSTQGASAAKRGDKARGKRISVKPLSSELPSHTPSLVKPRFVGVDVSKSWIDIADTVGAKQRVANEVNAIAAAFAAAWSNCTVIVCEATGGYERALMDVAKAQGLPLRRAHPNRVHAFAKASCGLAKTDALDAQGNRFGLTGAARFRET